MRCVKVVKSLFTPVCLARAGLALAALDSVVASAAPAHGFERQWRVGGGGGIAALSGASAGPAISAHAGYGISDMFDWNSELLASRHVGGDATTVISFGTGLSYKIDVFEWIPYVGLMGAGYVFDGAPGPNGESGLEAGGSVFGGLDYLFTRGFAAGVQIREHATFTDGLSFPYFSATLRFEHRWGF
jgi:hypothetical protein